MPARLGVCGPSGASNTRLGAGPLGTLWDCRNKSALACEAQILSKQYENDGSWGEWFARSPQQSHLSWPLRSIVPSGGQKGPSDALSPRGVGLTWLTTGPSRVRGDGSTLWVFWNKSALRADLRVFLRSRMPGLGVCGPSGASNITPQLAPGEHGL